MQPGNPRKFSLKAGAAKVDITPDPGISLTGFIARLGPSTGIHDRLSARALALAEGGQQALVLTCDLLALDARFVSSARVAIRAATGIAEEDILIACTHTHSGPATIFLRDCGEVDNAYLDHLRQSLVDAAREAVSNLRAARVAAGRGWANQGALNRRWPGKPIDPDLNMLAFRDEASQFIAILVNYACHPVCLEHTNRLISADYPGVLARVLQEQTGAVTLFTNGADGDINPQQMGSFAYAESLGLALSEEALRVLDTLEYRDCTDLRITNETLALPLNPHPTPMQLSQEIARRQQELARAEADGDAPMSRFHRALLGWAEDALSGSLRGSLTTSVPAEIQVICLGDFWLVGIPGEMFSELGREIKNLFPTHSVLLLGYANDDIGYIPTRQAYAAGGYEIDEAYKFYGYPAVLAPEAGDLLKQFIARLLDECPGRASSNENNCYPDFSSE